MTHDCLVDGLILSSEKRADSFCEACAFGKSKRASFPQNPERKKATSIGSLVYSDICGPLNIKSMGGSHYILIFKDDHSAYQVIYCISRKSETLSCFQDFVKTMKRETSQSVKILRSDREGKFRSHAFKEFVASIGGVQEFTTTHTPEQNGVSESENRTVLEMVRSMIFSSDVHPRFWAKASHTAIHILNRTLTRTLLGITPFEVWTGRKPFLAHVRIWGCDAYVHIPIGRSDMNALHSWVPSYTFNKGVTPV
jgi:transposase InsO family protein